MFNVVNAAMGSECLEKPQSVDPQAWIGSKTGFSPSLWGRNLLNLSRVSECRWKMLGLVRQDPTPIILVCRTPLRNPAAELLCSALLPLQLHFTAGWPNRPSLRFTKQQSEGGGGRTHLQGLSRKEWKDQGHSQEEAGEFQTRQIRWSSKLWLEQSGQKEQWRLVLPPSLMHAGYED